MNGMSLTFKSDKVDDVDAINTLGITAPLGAMSVSISADDNEDWDASVSYSAGALGFLMQLMKSQHGIQTQRTLLVAVQQHMSVRTASEFSVAGVEFTF
jgi:hypothetical protein